jgi:predicted ATPase with chaperone activity
MFRPPAARHRSWTNAARWERVDYNKLSSDRLGESSAAIQQRVEAAREIQRKRFGDQKSGKSAHATTCNADMRVSEVRQPQVQTGRHGR